MLRGWEHLICMIQSAAERAKWPRSTPSVESRPSLENGSLLLTPIDNHGLDPERVRGTVAAARVLSWESCDACGGPTHPVWPTGPIVAPAWRSARRSSQP